ncbi:hypothetical protein LCGC14_2820740 [marine sediment metagenome]|uniref:Uncharacterized protein n=1 Tax=marine sediment metagenome TaxID=412755 RepID=A0A0F9AQG6_9ZZZZ
MKILEYITGLGLPQDIETELRQYVLSDMFDRDVERIIANDDTVDINFVRECAIDQKCDELLDEQ